MQEGSAHRIDRAAALRRIEGRPGVVGVGAAGGYVVDVRKRARAVAVAG